MYGHVIYRPEGELLQREAFPEGLRKLAQRKPFDGHGTIASPLVMGWEIAVPKAAAGAILDKEAIRWLQDHSFSTNRSRLKWTRSDAPSPPATAIDHRACA